MPGSRTARRWRRGLDQSRRAAWGAVALASRSCVARFHQPADAGRSPGWRGCAAGVAINGPFARWRPSGPSPPWGRRCPIGRMRGQPFLGAPLSFFVLFLFSDIPSGSSRGRGPFALPPSSTVTRVLLTALRLVGGGARARRSRGLAADLLHQPTRGQWGRRPRARGHRADHEHGLPNTSRDACSGPSQSDL